MKSSRLFGKLLLLVLLLGSSLLSAFPHEAPLPFKLISVSGRMPDLDLQQYNDQGKKVCAQDYRGKAVLPYFG